jgi:hypothetical protein
MASQVKVTNREGALAVYCPYSKSFVSFAHMRGGKWSDGTDQWLFDPRDEFAVRSTLIDIYGTDDSASCQKIDVRLSLDNMAESVGGGRLFTCGREIARRRYWDRYVELGDDVVILAGGFPKKTRSYKALLEPEHGTVLEVRGVPVQAAERALRKHPNAVRLLGSYDLEALKAEREFHATRIAALNELIARREAIAEEDPLADLQDGNDAASDCSDGEAAEG